MPNGYNTAVKSIIWNNYNLFQTLLHEKSPFQKRIPQLFQIACEYNRLDIVKYLLQLRPKLHIRANDDRAFRLACSHGHLSVAKFLFEQASINNKINIARVFPDAVCSQYTYLVDWLYSTIRGKSSQPILTILHEACSRIIKSGEWKPIFRNIIYDCEYLFDIKPLFTTACIHNNAECARTFLDMLENAMKITGVSTALYHKSYDVISILLNGIYDPYDLFETLISACGNGDETFLNIMVSHYNYDGIEWMFSTIALEAFHKKQTHIVHRILEIYPELPFDIINSVEKYEHYRDLYNYLVCLHPEYMLWFDMEIELPQGEHSCSICLCEHDTYVRTNCGHVFGKNCIMQWIAHDNINCPMCRRAMI
jgi:hypothetical protein